MTKYKFITHIKYVILNYHDSILSDKLTVDKIKKERSKLLFHKEPFNLNICIKNYYKYLFFLSSNLFNKIMLNYRTDDEYIKKILNKEDIDMKELRDNTKNATDKNDMYSGIMYWIAGNCWLNALITNNYNHELTDKDKLIINSINETIKIVKPISKPLTFYHGFEKFTNYNENQF